MAKEKKTNLEKVVENSRSNRPDKDAVSDLKVYTVEPVVKPEDKRKKPKGEIKNDGKKPPRKQDGKTNKRATEEGEKKLDAGKKASVPVPDRKRRKNAGGILDKILPPWF